MTRLTTDGQLSRGMQRGKNEIKSLFKSIQVGYTVKFDHRKFIGQFNNVLKLWQARQS